ncbi:hypothetical protein [Prolixibacter sp. SD074]|jgi:hypothetical protein|uniref:hypothetical protein n=1 Tax=Prolixibacter sp. SD074 TaxID=2652391 RepID=UPI001278BD82|nr:hypothetical protein [Prolixibacter sp. SD074]GET30783.1 hypothetical protein SD074_29850 [Prolixibacter sp. SD074]
MAMDKDNIELRSEKVRNIIGKIPPRIVRIGISVLFVIVSVVLVGSYFFRYPETVQGEAVLLSHVDSSSNYYVQVTLPYRFITKIQQHQSALIEMEGYDKSRYGLLRGKLIKMSRVPVTMRGMEFFKVTIRLDNGMATTQMKRIPFYPNMKGNARIVVGEQPLLEKLIAPLSTLFSKNK